MGEFDKSARFKGKVAFEGYLKGNSREWKEIQEGISASFLVF